MDGVRLMTTLSIGFVFGSVAFLYVLTDFSLITLIVGIILLAFIIGLAVKGGSLREQVNLGMFVPSVTVGIFIYKNVELDQQLLVAVSVLSVVVSIFVFYWILSKVWSSLIFVAFRTLLIMQTLNGMVLHEGTKRLTKPMPIFERIFARIPLYTMRSEFMVKDIDTRERYNIDIKVHIRYVLKDKSVWNRVMGMPNRPSVFQEITREFGGNMQDIIFWERVFDRLVREEVDIVLRKWIHEVEDVPSLLDSTAANGNGGKSGKSPRASTTLLRERKKLANTVLSKLQETFDIWGLDIKSIEFLNIKLDEEYVRHVRFEQHRLYQQDYNELEAERLSKHLNARAVSQASAIEDLIVSVGKGLKYLEEGGNKPSPELVDSMMRAAMQELTLIFRLDQDTQYRLDSTDGLNN
jgi:hypothetical protein